MGRATRIALGVITYRRLAGLRRLLKSLGQLDLPKDAICSILIVENESEGATAKHLESLRSLVPFDIVFESEPIPGIPFARNRVLRMALARGFDFLTFVDDDEVVHHEWLKILHGHMELRQLDLAGGPNVVVQAETPAMHWQNRLVLRQMTNDGNVVLRKRAEKSMTADECDIPIYTNNWMLRLATQKKTQVWFDTGYQYSGGSDTKFYMDLTSAGARSGWVNDARTYEVWPLHRLTFSYLYRRTRDQRATGLIRSGKVIHPAFAVLRYLASCYVAFGHLLRSPFNNGRGLTRAITTMAAAACHLRAARGQRSELYQRMAEVHTEEAKPGTSNGY